MLVILAVCGTHVTAFAQSTDSDSSTPEISQLMEQLQKGELQERRDAAWALAALGPAAEPAIAALAPATADEDPQVANGALLALGRIGPPAAVAIPEIFAQLRERDSQRRYRAAYALGRTATAEHPLLLEGLKDSSSSLRAASLEAVGWMQDGAAPLLDQVAQAVADDNANVATAASATLTRLGPMAVPVLDQLLRHTQPSVQRRAAECLEQIGIDGAAAATGLRLLCDSEQADVRAAAIGALAKVAPNDKSTLECVQRSLIDPEGAVVAAAVTAVIELGERAADTVPQLIQTLAGPPEVASLAAVALGHLQTATLPHAGALLERLTTANETAIANTVAQLGPAVLPAVLQATADGKLEVGQAARIIGQIGPRVSSALDGLIASERPTDRAVAAGALALVRRQPSSVDQLIALLDDPTPQVRAAAAASLAELGELAQKAQTRLQSSITDAEDAVRGTALAALVAVGTSTEVVTPALVLGLRDAAADVRRQAAVAFARLDSLSPAAVSALVEALKDSDSTVRSQAAAALGQSDASAQAAAAALVEALRDAEGSVALAAAQSLSKVNQLDQPAVEALLQLLDHPSIPIRATAIGTLAKGGDAARQASERIAAFRQDAEAELRIASLRTLAALAAEDSQRIEILLAGLEDDDWTVRKTAAEQLGGLGSVAAPAVPRLIELMQSAQDSEAAASALRRIDAAPPEAMPRLLDILRNRDSDRRLRFFALYLIRKSGAAAKEALPALREIRDQTQGRARESLDRAIREIED
jgi:HEAT repeat protein